MKKILYYMHVPWNWAKQRPHFLAENLAEYFKVDVVEESSFHGKHLSKNNVSPGIAVHTLKRLPYDRNSIISFVNKQLIQWQLGKQIRKYDIIWLTHPLLYKRIKGILPANARLVYDCMDDHLEFPVIKANPKLEEEIRILEKELIERADLTFCSSGYLKNKLVKKYATEKEIIVVNNSIELNNSTVNPSTDKTIEAIIDKVTHEAKDYRYKVTYVGTISSWLDFDLVLHAASQQKDVVFLFFGPSEVEIPKHKQIRYFGPIPHHAVYPVLALSDALVMPFKLSELILAVDPVKLYEYIYCCKPTIAVRYGETEKFAGYVYLYNRQEEFAKHIQSLAEGKLPIMNTAEAHKAFAHNNTWKTRALVVNNYLNKL